MKILLISNMYPSRKNPSYGTFVNSFKQQLEDKNIIFDLAVIRGKGQCKIEKIKKYFYFFKDVIYKIKQNDYDMIYVHYISHSLLPLLFVQKYINKPLVLNAHGSDVFVNNKLGGFIQKIVLPIIKKATMVVVPSDYFQDILFKKFGISKDKIFVSPSGGVNTDLFKPLGLKKNAIFTIGYVSRIDKGKGWDVFLDSIKVLNSKELTFKVLIVGSGSQENELRKKISDLQLYNIIEYVGGKSHNELPILFNKMDIFVFPTTLNESLGLVGLESMACGTPVIGSNIGGLPSYIKDEVNGSLFEVGNSRELSENIEKFIKMQINDFNIYKSNSINKSKEYDAKMIAQKLSDILKNINKEYNK